MAYEPTNWQAGDIVTSAKLNKIEQGIASHDMVEGIMENNVVTLNKTWQEIWDNNYTNVVLINKNDDSYKEYKSIKSISKAADDGPYIVSVAIGSSPNNFICNSPDDYPSDGASPQSGR